MAKGWDSHLTIWENNGWFKTVISNPYNPIINSEGLKRSRSVSERNSMVRPTRAMFSDSLVFEESKPEGFIEVTPRMENLSPILMSHFQMTTQVDTGSSFIDTFVPSKTNPTFTDNNIYGNGGYGSPPGDVFSIDIWKKHRDYTYDNGLIDGFDTLHFKRGICNTLSFSMKAGEDFSVKADYKFKDFEILETGSNPGDAGYSDYSSGSITDWSHGTWTLTAPVYTGGVFDVFEQELTSFDVSCSNNLTEKKNVGAGTRQTFSFGDYTVKGKIGFEFTDESYQRFGDDVFVSIIGTIFHSTTEYMVIELPHCTFKPFDTSLVKPSSFIEASIPFEAYEFEGAAPITVTVHVGEQAIDTGIKLYDAGSTTRTLSEYDFADAGSTTRTLSQYDFADRDF